MLRLACIVALALMLGGCALTVDRVDLAYLPTASAPIDGAQAAPPVSVTVTDGRLVRVDRISTKKNGYGMEMAPILANQAIPGFVRGAVETELRTRGFPLADGARMVTVEVTKFYADFRQGFFSGDCIGEVILNIQVRDGTQILFSRAVTGEGWARDIQLASGENAKQAIELALRDAVGKLVDDPGFLQGLLRRAGTGAVTS